MSNVAIRLMCGGWRGWGDIKDVHCEKAHNEIEREEDTKNDEELYAEVVSALLASIYSSCFIAKVALECGS